MKENPKQIERIAQMSFASVYPHYVEKVKRKGRTIEELHTVLQWLTGYTEEHLRNSIVERISFESFFNHALINSKADLVKGSICGYKIEAIENPLLKKVRILDKLVDELAKGKKIEKILRN